MAENSGFFASVGGDRQYTTDFLADWVSSFISNGVYNGELAVTAGDGMTVKIPAGRAWINGYYYHNDSELTLTIDNADGVLNRIDAVVLRWDVNARSITAQVIKGTPASSPMAPQITRTVEQYDLKLAEISIPAGTTAITQSLITDTRLDNDACGIVHGVVQQVDTTTLYAQIQDDLMRFRATNEADFTAWVNGLKDVLDENTAGNLLNLIEEHKADGTQHAKTARFVIGTSTSGWTEKDCDYLCDGTNDQEEIIQALNDLPATGGEVVILDGTYNITASINIPKDNVSLRGNGNATILKRMYNSTDTESGATARGLITLNEKSGCKIQGLQIDGNKAIYTASYNYGIYLYSSSDNTVTGNTCSNNNGDGIYLYSSSDNTVTGNTCNNNNGDGIYLYSSSDNTVTGNTCSNNINGILITLSSDNNTVTGNTCNNNNYDGILITLSSDNNTVTGNTCNNNNHTGICLTSSSDNTVTGNTCSNNNINGILLTSSSNNNTVTGNTCNNNNRTGICLYSSSDNTVTGNTCIRGTGQTSDYDSDQYTIRLRSISKYNLISSNNCMGKDVVIEGGTSNTSVNNKYN